MRTKGDPAPSSQVALSGNQSAVDDCVTMQKITPTNANRLDSESNVPVNWVTPFSSPQDILKSQPMKQAIDVSAALAKLPPQHLKLKDTQPGTTSKPVGLMTFATSSSTAQRAPTAQMVSLPSKAVVATTAAATASLETLTMFPVHPQSNPHSNPYSNPYARALFTPASPTKISLSPIVPSSSPTNSSRQSASKRTPAPKTPQIMLTPAPATAPSACKYAFKGPALAIPVRNTKLLNPLMPQTNGVKKRPYTKKSSPLRSALTPDPILNEKEKRIRGRPRIRFEEQSVPKNGQQWLLSEPCTPVARISTPNDSSQSLLPSRQEQVVALQVNSGLHPLPCSEVPRLWPGRGDYVTSLLRYPSKPETVHCEPVQTCANRAAHQDAHNPYDHGVCTTCRRSALRHIYTTRSDLHIMSWWPLCKACGIREMMHLEPRRSGCSCPERWLCFSCLVDDLERQCAQTVVEAEHRRGIIGKAMNGGVMTVMTGFVCDCGKEVDSDATLMKCVLCQGLRAGSLDPRAATAREKFLRKTALAWM